MNICYWVIINKVYRYPFGDSREMALAFARDKREEGYKDVKVAKEVNQKISDYWLEEK